MKDKNIYMIRHGEISTSSEKTYIGILDINLSNKGIDEGKKLKAFFDDVPIDKIYSSDLKRSEQTANIIIKDKNLKLIKLSELREINLGQWEGKTFREIKYKYPLQFENRIENIEDFKTQEGESFRECQNRAIHILKKIVSEEGSNIVIVSHAGVNRVILAYILEIPLKNIFRIAQNYGCINKIVFNEKGYKIEYINYIL